MVEETYRGHRIRFTEWRGKWFVSDVVREEDGRQLPVSVTGTRNFAQALRYARLLIDEAGPS